MKLGISLSDQSGRSLASLASAHKTSASAVVEVALGEFVLLDKDRRASLLRRHRASKRAATRTGWMGAFWELLADERGGVDFAHGDADRCLVDRTYGDHCLVFLNQSAFRPDAESEGFILHIFARTPNAKGSPFPSHNIAFERNTPVDQAARKVSDWLRKRSATKA